MKNLHPLRTGALYGLIAGILNVVLAYVNLTYLDKNVLLSSTYNIIIPIVAIYLASHLTGRQERLILGTTITSGTRATLTGTTAGIGTGAVYIIVSAILTWVAKSYLGLVIPATSTGPLGGVLDILKNASGFIVWLIFGALAGTVGGFFGDSRAHKQLKSGAIQPAPAAAATKK